MIAEDKAWESETLAFVIDGRAYTIADFRRITDRLFNPEDWKAPWAALVPYDLVAAAIAATEWFHADRPTIVGIEPAPGTGRVILRGNGYQA